MTYLDRFAPPVDPPLVAYCAHCGGEIYAGDEVKRVDDGGGFVCHNYGTDCATRYAEERVFDAIGTINIRGEID